MSEQLINLIYLINAQSGVPIYRQIMDQTTHAIVTGVLQADQLMPSVRSLASHLQINPMTISKAFSNLENEGVLIRKRGVGMLVASNQTSRTISTDTTNALQTFIDLAKQDLSNDEIIALVQQHLAMSRKKGK